MGFLKTCSDPIDSKFIFARISNNLYETLSVSVREVVRVTGHIVCVAAKPCSFHISRNKIPKTMKLFEQLDKIRRWGVSCELQAIQLAVSKLCKHF
jgi:hypothetical protein